MHVNTLKRVAGALVLAGAGLRADVTLVRDRQPQAVIVTPENPSAGVRYAAEELAWHVEKATGVKLPIYTEAALPEKLATPLYLGDTRAARAAGVDPTKLALETCVLRTAPNSSGLIIAGRDGSGDPLDRDTSAGTLFGVYEWLERELHVRWLWPGELGTFVPKTSTLIAPAIDETIVPRFFQRHVRAGLGHDLEHPALGFTPKAAEAYAKDQNVFFRRNRMGRSEHMSYGHAFTDWWAKYGQTHPEWFQLVNGQRGPIKPGARYSMCVSNPELQKEIVRVWQAKGAGDFINVVENDIVALCECENCRAWDGPNPPDMLKFYSPQSKVWNARFASDRYARFELAVQQLAAKVNPRVTAIGYVYFNYFQAPTSGVKLNPHVLLGYCPSGGFYPQADDEHAWYLRQWQGWRDTGARLFMRTNYFLDGYCMPYIFAHQFADQFQHAVRNGLVATDFDSLTGHWATQGPNLYLLFRLHTRPDAKPDDLLAEYYSGFGPAAPAVKAYFDYWENYTMGHRQLILDSFAARTASRWRAFAKAADLAFPATCWAEGAKFLEQAAAAARNDRDAAARVQFLRDGLAHARLSAKVSALLSTGDPASTPERGAAALKELLLFRRAHERQGIDNFNHDAWVEDASWKLSNETKQEAELYP